MEIPLGVEWRGSEGFDRQGMQPAADKILQRIIHKAMARHAGAAGEHRRGNPHPEMGAKTALVGPSVARMRCAFVDDFEAGGRQEFLEAIAQRVGSDSGTHDFEAPSSGR
jgi:hypothetical protein